MTFTKTLLSYFLTLTVFLAIDFTWLGFIAKNIYQKYLGSFLTPNVNWIAAFVFYALFVLGIMIFVVHPAFLKNSVKTAAIYGALFGLFTYATYDLTNLATLKDWPLAIVFIDIVWGMFLSAIVSITGYYIMKMLS